MSGEESSGSVVGRTKAAGRANKSHTMGCTNTMGAMKLRAGSRDGMRRRMAPEADTEAMKASTKRHVHAWVGLGVSGPSKRSERPKWARAKAARAGSERA